MSTPGTRPESEPALERAPELSIIVVHWRDEEHLMELVRGWPATPSYELVVVDNSGTLGVLPETARLISPGRNLGFAGGVNRGLAVTRSAKVLILNSDARPLGNAIVDLIAAFDDFPDAAGIVPALVGADGSSQHRWQLQPLPGPFSLVLQTFFLAGQRGPKDQPPRGTAVQQPAAAALALRRDVLLEIEGLDEGFFPAWFEDVDLAKRLAGGGHRLVYTPEARFEHAGGATVSRLGYGPFLWVYYRGLSRYLRLHHGQAWSAVAHLTLACGLLLRLALLPLRRPQRATSRRDAAKALLATISGALSGWRRPTELATRFAPRGSG